MRLSSEPEEVEDESYTTSMIFWAITDGVNISVAGTKNLTYKALFPSGKKTTDTCFSLTRGIGMLTFVKGSKAMLISPQMLQVSFERNWPLKTSVTMLEFRAR